MVKSKKVKKERYYNQKSFIKGAIRRLFSRSPMLLSILKKAIHPTIKGIRGGKQFICAKCKKTFAQKDVQVDHILEINEMIPTKHMSYNMMVERIFCKEDNLQVLCINCHKEKTNKFKKLKKENSKRFKYIVYETKNIINGKKYIGVHGCVNLDDEYLGSGIILLKALKKYGIENFERSILFATFDKEEAYKKETELITTRIIEDDIYYNLKSGGIGGTLSEKSRLKMSKTMKGRYIGEKNPNFGKKHSIEIRKKIGNRNYATGHKHFRAKSVQCIETGKKFKSIIEASRFYGNEKNSHIGAVCRGERNKAFGFTWKFINKE